MKHISFCRTISFGKLSLPVLPNNCSGYYTAILKSIHDQLEAMLSYHSRIMVVRVDLHLSNYYENNAIISNFLRKLKKRLLQKFCIRRLGYIWSREKENAESQHYHLALILDANSVRYPFTILKFCEEIWQSFCQPKPYTPKNCFYIIQRGHIDSLARVFQRLSYLAKTQGKGQRARFANDYSSSRVKRRVSSGGAQLGAGCEISPAI